MYLLTEWEGRTGKYLARGHDVRTERSEVRASWPRAKYFPVRPDQTQSISILSYDPLSSLFFCVFSCCFFFRWATSGFVSRVFSRSQWYCANHERSQWRCRFENAQNWSKFSSFGFNFDKILCEKITFSLNKHTIQMLVLWTKGCCETRTKKITKRMKAFVYWKIWPHDADVSSELNFVKLVLNQKTRE